MLHLVYKQIYYYRGVCPLYNIIISKRIGDYYEGYYYGQSYKIDKKSKKDVLSILTDEESEEVLNFITEEIKKQ